LSRKRARRTMFVAMPYEETPSTRKARALFSTVLWLVLAPFFVGMWFWFGWWVLIGVAGAIWWTRDYILSGGIDADYVGRAGGWPGKPRSNR
ncbi:MAG: hypothetical protein ABFR95_11370, partial [Actinomycetota bacterium]